MLNQKQMLGCAAGTYEMLKDARANKDNFLEDRALCQLAIYSQILEISMHEFFELLEG